MCDLGILRRQIVSPFSSAAETPSSLYPVRISVSPARPSSICHLDRPVNKYSEAICMELWPQPFGPRTKLNRSNSKTVSWCDLKFFKASFFIRMGPSGTVPCNTICDWYGTDFRSGVREGVGSANQTETIGGALHVAYNR